MPLTEAQIDEIKALASVVRERLLTIQSQTSLLGTVLGGIDVDSAIIEWSSKADRLFASIVEDGEKATDHLTAAIDSAHEMVSEVFGASCD